MNFIELFEKANQLLSTKYSKRNGYSRLDNPAELLRHFSSRLKSADLSPDEKVYISRLPIDLMFLHDHDHPEEKPYVFFILNAAPNISQDFQKTVHFCQYYLTLLINTNEFELTLVAHKDSKIDKFPYYEERKGNGSSALNFFINNGLGLLIVDDAGKKVDKLSLDPKTLRNLTKDSFCSGNKVQEVARSLTSCLLKRKVLPKKKKAGDYAKAIAKALTDNWDDIALFFDTYIHHAVKATTRNPICLEPRHLSAPLLRKVCSANNLCYCNDLSVMISKYLSDKGDEFDFCRNVCIELWQKHLKVPYSEVFDRWDRVLRDIFSMTGYRDHFLHEFQVFLMGTYILDKIANKIPTIPVPYHDIGKSWLLASTFHDFAYPVQKYNDFSKEFFKEFLKVDNLAFLELKSRVVENSLLSCIGSVILCFLKRYTDRKLEPNWLSDEKGLLNFFHEKVTTELDHGVLAGISLLKLAEYHAVKKQESENIFVPAALSICLHHKGWEKRNTIRKKGRISPVKRENILTSLEFTSDPLSFILIFCDAIQEWGRPRGIETSISLDETEFELKDFEYRDNTFEFTIVNSNYPRTKQFWKDKDTELENLAKFLRQDSNIADFLCRIEDCKGDHSEHRMTGP